MSALLKIVDQHGRPYARGLSSGEFEGASFSRRMGDWGLSQAGPDASLFGSLDALRARSRELTRNESLISSGLDSLVASLTGTGIKPRWTSIENPKVKTRLQEDWGDWIEVCDHDGVCDYYGLQSLATRCMIESGEALIRVIPQRPGSMQVPLKLQVIEPDHLPVNYNELLDNGNQIRMGIEFDKRGQRVNYHVYKEHPGEAYLNPDPGAMAIIPANEMIHIYRVLRPGQKRGRPWVAPILIAVHDLGEYLDAEQVRKTTTAMFGGFITVDAGIQPDIPGIMGSGEVPTGQSDFDAEKIIPLEPGTFPKLPPGMDVKFSQPADVGGMFEHFVKGQQRRIARGYGNQTYEALTGDLSDANYSSLRAGNLGFQRFCLQIIHQVVSFQMNKPIGRAWINYGYLSGGLKLPGFQTEAKKYYRIEWRHDGWPVTDPLKDGNAAINDLNAGLNSRSAVIAERFGKDAETVDREIAEDQKRAESLNLNFVSAGQAGIGQGKDDDD